MFDAKEFLSATQEGTLDDKFLLHPEGEFTFQIPMDPEKAFEVKSGEKQQDDGSMRPWAQMALKLETVDPMQTVEKALSRKPGITDRFFLDLDKNGGFDHSPQKNIRMGQYLTATQNNKSGWKFTDLCGKQVKGKVVWAKSDFGDGKQAKVTVLGVA